MGEKLIVDRDSKIVFCALSFDITTVDLSPVDSGHEEFKFLPMQVFAQFGRLYENTGELPRQPASHPL